MKALIVEPSRLFRNILTSIFSDRGFQCTATERPAPALELFSENDIDLVCVAMHMSDMDSMDFCRSIRNNPEKSTVPIIMITSSDNKLEFEDAMSGGITDIFHRKELNDLALYLEQQYKRATDKACDSGKILYVEDDKVFSSMVKAALSEYGFELSHFVNAEDALQCYQNNSFDLVLTDLMLAGEMSGSSLVCHIRNLPGRDGEVPILVMSGFSESQKKIDLLKLGVNDYVTKPIVLEELVMRVNNLVTLRQLLDQNIRQQHRLNELAMHDQLTGLYNRHFLMDRGPSLLADAKRYKYPVSLLMVDIDFFKKINDTHGHGTGDNVLHAVGELLARDIRAGDIAARFGGEEFVLVLGHCGMQDAMTKAESLRMAMEKLQPEGLTVTASIGVASLENVATTSFEGLFDIADKAVYSAKKEGRNCVRNGFNA